MKKGFFLIITIIIVTIIQNLALMPTLLVCVLALFTIGGISLQICTLEMFYYHGFTLIMVM